jgi:hypothetical protein
MALAVVSNFITTRVIKRAPGTLTMPDYVTSDSSGDNSDNESIGQCPGDKLAADPNHYSNAWQARFS